jgi:hypothetical protein
MRKYFNVAGPCREDEHYMIDATERLHNELADLIDSKQYFVIHAARQVGKTTLLLNYANILNKSGKYYALYCSLEKLDGVIDPEVGMTAIINAIKIAARRNKIPFYETFAVEAQGFDYANIVNIALEDFCAKLDKPLVVFFDEADCLSEGTLISFLRQLRDGYVNRSIAPFPVSVALVGMRNIRDYKAKVRDNQATLGTASPFNIIKQSLTLRNFNKEEVYLLYNQHTTATGQVFEKSAIELVFEQTQGQPWLVNAIACEVIEQQLKKDFSIPITPQMIETAINTIILRRDVHIDQLLDKLKDERVKKIVEPMILGEKGKIDPNSDDFQYVMDLGLIRVTNEKIEPANPIYAEVIVRTLNSWLQGSLLREENQYQMPRYYKNGEIDMELLLQEFQGFWRENGAIWEERFEYKEAAPHLILMAFLQRIINGGGHIIREMSAEKGRLDLCVVYMGKKYPLELKILYSSKTIPEGLEQTARYMDSLGCQKGYLIVFDRDKNKSWDEKIYQKPEKVDGKMIDVFGC